jgi:hypothetical protein
VTVFVNPSGDIYRDGMDAIAHLPLSMAMLAEKAHRAGYRIALNERPLRDGGTAQWLELIYQGSRYRPIQGPMRNELRGTDLHWCRLCQRYEWSRTEGTGT